MVLNTSRKIPANSDLGWIDIPIPEGRNPQSVSWLSEKLLYRNQHLSRLGARNCVCPRDEPKKCKANTQNDFPESSLIFTETILQTRNLRLVQSKPKTLVSLLNPNFSASKVHVTPHYTNRPPNRGNGRIPGSKRYPGQNHIWCQWQQSTRKEGDAKILWDCVSPGHGENEDLVINMFVGMHVSQTHFSNISIHKNGGWIIMEYHSIFLQSKHTQVTIFQIKIQSITWNLLPAPSKSIYPSSLVASRVWLFFQPHGQ